MFCVIFFKLRYGVNNHVLSYFIGIFANIDALERFLGNGSDIVGSCVNVAELCRQTHGAVEIEYLFSLFVLLVNRQQNKYSVGDDLTVQMMVLFGALENGEAVVDRVSKTGRIIDLNEVRDKSC